MHRANAFGAIKAITAASLARHGNGVHRVTLDQVIETMRQTGADMSSSIVRHLAAASRLTCQSAEEFIQIFDAANRAGKPACALVSSAATRGAIS